MGHNPFPGVLSDRPCQRWKKLMKDIVYFLYKLLPAASKNVKWTKKTVDRAVTWGLRCERGVARCRRGGTIRGDINDMARQNQHIGSFRDLLSARRLLLERLLQNQLLEEDVREHVQQVSHNILGPKQASNAEAAARQQQQHASILLRMLTKTQHDDVHTRLRARLMLEAKDGQPEYVRECLSKVAHSQVILQDTIVASLMEGEGSVVQVGPAVAQWMQDVLASRVHRHHRQVLQGLCSLPPHLLSKTLATHTHLLMALLQCLHREARNLQPSYDGDGCHWLPRGPSILTWEDLVNTYNTLVSHPSLATHVQEAVERWSMLEGGAVWGEVVRQAKATCTSTPSNTTHSQAKREENQHV